MAKQDWKTKGFHYHAGYLTYQADLTQSQQFVGRFKFQPYKTATDFKRFLIANFTPAEYFSRLANQESPLPILQSKGYVLPHIRTTLAKEGYPVTPEGFTAYIRDGIKRREAQAI